MYHFRRDGHWIFIGETDNLRLRIERHFDTGGQAGIPDWLFDRGSKIMTLGIVPTVGVSPIERKIVELGAVRRFRPYFNYVGGRVA